MINISLTGLPSDHDPMAPWDLEAIWRSHHRRVLGLARKLIGGRCQICDEDDIAQCVFQAFFNALEAGQLVRMRDAQDIWCVLASITRRSVVNQYRYENRLRRRASDVDVNSTVSDGEMACRRPGPAEDCGGREFVTILLDCLQNDTQRNLAVCKMDGYTNAELADQCRCSSRTIERRLAKMRKLMSRRIPVEMRTYCTHQHA